jgi:hypothetical protein
MMTAAQLPVPGNHSGSRHQSDLADIANVSAADAVIIGRPHIRYGVNQEMENLLKSSFALKKTVGTLEIWVRSPK